MSTKFPSAVALAMLVLVPAAHAAKIGELIITELMADPLAVSDTNGEYIEVYNNSGTPYDFNGIVFVNGNNRRVTVQSSIVALPGSFTVFGLNDDAATNGGVDVDYKMVLPSTAGGVFLRDSNDTISIIRGTTIVFTVSYTDGDAFGDGVAMELSSIALGLDGVAVGPQSGADYVASTTRIAGEGSDIGSPGTAGSTIIATAIPEPLTLTAGLLGMAALTLRRAGHGA